MKIAYIETWTESESGWGIKSDGVSLHLSKDDYKKYIDNFWEKEKEKNPSGKTPEIYTRQDNNLKMVRISEKLYQELLSKKKQFGIRLWDFEFNKKVEQKQIIF